MSLCIFTQAYLLCGCLGSYGIIVIENVSIRGVMSIFPWGKSEAASSAAARLPACPINSNKHSDGDEGFSLLHTVYITCYIENCKI